MRIFLAIFIFYFPLMLQGQQKEIDVDYEIQGNFKDFKNFDFDNFIKKDLKHSSLSIYGSELLIKRDLDFNYKQEIYTAKFLYNEEPNRGLKFIAYEISILKKGDTIIGLINIDRYRKKINYYVDYAEINELIKLHTKFYNEKSTINDLIDGFTNRKDYGYCILKEDLEKFPILDYFIQKNNVKIETMIKLLRSYSPEDRVFGVFGINYLQTKSSINLNDEIQKLIKHIKKEELKIENCKKFDIIQL